MTPTESALRAYIAQDKSRQYLDIEHAVQHGVEDFLANLKTPHEVLKRRVKNEEN